MSPEVFAAFDAACRAADIIGPVLEIGAVPNPHTLLCLPSIQHVAARIGINQDSLCQSDEFKIMVGNANQMSGFADASFGAVLCNSTLEHDPRFWLTLAEIRRITKPGGFVAIGVPGYAGMGAEGYGPLFSLSGFSSRVLAAISRDAGLNAGTVTLGVHDYPGDYFRFSEQAVREVFLEGMTDIQIIQIMHPPRLIGTGRKP